MPNQKDMLGNPAELQRFIAGPIADLTAKACGKNGGLWQSAIKRLARGDRDPFGPGVYVCDVDYGLDVTMFMARLSAIGFVTHNPGFMHYNGPQTKTSGIEEVVFRMLYFDGRMATRASVIKYVNEHNLAFLTPVEIQCFFLKLSQVLEEFGVVAFVSGSEDGKKIAGEFFFGNTEVSTQEPPYYKKDKRSVKYFGPDETYGGGPNVEFSPAFRFLVKEV